MAWHGMQCVIVGVCVLDDGISLSNVKVGGNNDGCDVDQILHKHTTQDEVISLIFVKRCDVCVGERMKCDDVR